MSRSAKERLRANEYVYFAGGRVVVELEISFVDVRETNARLESIAIKFAIGAYLDPGWWSELDRDELTPSIDFDIPEGRF